MSQARTTILVGGASLVLEILLPSKTAISDYSPRSSKNLINQNWLKKFMQVEIDVTYMHTNCAGRCLSCFGDTATFQNSQFSLSDHVLYSMVIKKFNQLELAQKIHANRI